MTRVSKRKVDIHIGGNPRTPAAKVGILAGVGLAIVLLAVFHSAVLMGCAALILVILWAIAPRRK